MAKKLPLGLQDFREIIEGGYKYIDKTAYVHRLCSSGKYYFLSRPRRFGKSITVSVLNELYSGSQELFKGLWIENKWNWSNRHPVIRLALTGIGFQQSGLLDALDYQLNQLIERHGLKPIEANLSNKFQYILRELAQTNKVVVLIDEYDAPIVHYLGMDLEKAYANREILKEFFSVLKNSDDLLELVFLTGVSKFSKVGVFSGLNNLTDLTMHPQYATMMGYTQEELEDNFVEEIDSTAQHMSLTREELLVKMRHWYNGYRFHSEGETVYNPVSVNMFFDQQEFKNFWFTTGTPTFLINLLKQEGLYDFKLVPQSEQSFDTFDLEDLNPFGLLYQTGYLTIKEKFTERGRIKYRLEIPNLEIQFSLNDFFIDVLTTQKSEKLVFQDKLYDVLKAGDLDGLKSILVALFASIPYQNFTNNKIADYEGYYASVIYAYFASLGFDITAEDTTSKGRIDLTLKIDSNAYIFEFKVVDKATGDALAQIKSKQYQQKYQESKNSFLIGIEFGRAERNVVGFEWEKVG
ncbi:MAG: ATP-binding protein [Saprospiraceae bacterium]|nr:ATP-binding protein [Saprospiraceae bacterium]